ncbi:Meiotically up-regulated protein 86 protein [Tilletia horrida]|nr:Meiotically up-regulated protein 86 protein [Tilletia horrida]KAK0527238.1 Meiotically up-regulated protein 86 protein [Tilletia horrida]KAK0558454.1 Meiotically up-regulated protein 86 protein [Tilletia horrida]
MTNAYWKTYDGKGAYRQFANTEVLGWVAHALAALTFGSYLTNWRAVSSPNLIVAASLGFASFGLYLSAIGAFFNNDVFNTAVHAAVGGLWAGLSLIYLPASGILSVYTSEAAAKSAPLDLPNALALYLLWWGIAFLVVSFLALKRHINVVGIALTGSVALFLLSGAYFNPASTHFATAVKVGGYFLWLSGLIGAIHFILGVLTSEKHFIQIPIGALRGDVNDHHEHHQGPASAQRPVQSDLELGHGKESEHTH